jgi:hypothetical protein
LVLIKERKRKKFQLVVSSIGVKNENKSQIKRETKLKQKTTLSLQNLIGYFVVVVVVV